MPVLFSLQIYILEISASMKSSLFLTSSPCAPAPETLAAPFVMSEENGFLALLRQRLCASPRLLLIASDPGQSTWNDRMLEDFILGFRASGFENAVGLMLDERDSTPLSALLDVSDLVLLCGGHVPTQNRYFARLRLGQALRSYEGVILGISAGSMNAATTVYAQPEEPGESLDPDYDRFPPGLGLTDVHILPHLNMTRNDILDGYRLFEDITFADSSRMPFLAIPDGSFVLCENGRETLYGEGHLIEHGVMRRLCSKGETLAL